MPSALRRFLLGDRTRAVRSTTCERTQDMTIRYLVLVAAIAFSGCASVPNQPYNKAANAHVKRIGVLLVSNPGDYEVSILHHPGSGFGLVGGLIALGDMNSKS